MASIGRHVFEPQIVDILAETKASAGGESQLTDAINRRPQDGHVGAVPLSDARYDGGSNFG